ncbi:TPA: hypothetical protein ACPVXB_004315 [Vibrio parahaemolyticus]
MPMKNVPDYLYSLPTEIEPPVQSKIQDLPFDQLTWDNFERLTLRYIESSGKLEHCHMYGKRGQAQEGIDLFVRHGTDKLYTVYQCKRYKEYSVTNLKDAVTTFSKGAWVDKTRHFYICISCDAAERKLSDEIETQAKILKQKGIDLFVLDKAKFSNKLKLHPNIVYDFFGKEWVRLFCGEEYLVNYENRLSASDFGEYKQKLGKFYYTLFENHEGSISNLSGQNTTPNFEDRYIVPDVVNSIYVGSYDDEFTQSDMSKSSIDNMSIELIDEIDTDSGAMGHIHSSTYQANENIENRVSSLDWIATEKNTVVIGGAGSGKSALLKYIVLGLLDKITIKNSSLRENRSKLIPVWLPFGFWTNYMEAQPNASLVDCMRAWFSGMNHEDLWPLMESAIADDRLLLVVDGLDEWSSRQTALICLQKLTVFIKEKEVSSILSSRPSGIERLNMNTNNWSIGHLTGLSKEQQKTLIEICIGYRVKNQHNIDSKLYDLETRKISHELVSEISRSKDLLDLASIPLLIYMLIHLKTKNISLPHSRFSVYKELILDLVKVQPQRRRTAAQLITARSSFSEGELISILSKLAYEIQVNYPHGNVPIENAKSFIKEYLLDESKEFGLCKREAIRQTDEFVDIGESEIGILVKKSTDEIGFFHRSLQEFLAANYISTETSANQNILISKYIFNEQWMDVFLGLLSLLQKTSDVEELVDYIVNLNCEEHEEMFKELFLAKIAFGDNKCSASTAKKISKKIFNSIETGGYLPHRRELIKIVVGGYNSNKLHSEIVNIIGHWVPEQERWRKGLFEQVDQHWPADDITRNMLFVGLSGEDIHSKINTSNIIVRKFSSDKETLRLLMKIIKETLNYETRMLATSAVFGGWVNSREAKSLYNNLEPSSSRVAILLRVFYESKQGIFNEKNREFLIACSEFNRELSYYWNNLILECLTLGYIDDSLRIICMERVFSNGSRNFDYDIARKILFDHFYDNQEFIDVFIEDLKSDRSSLLLPHDMDIEFIKKVIRKSEFLHNEMEEWVIGNDFVSYSAYHLFKTERMKKHLLEQVFSDTSFIHWPVEALLYNWGIVDVDVKDAIQRLVNENVDKSSMIAHLYPVIFEDKNECYNRLISLIKSKDTNRMSYDRIVKAILSVSNDDQREEAFGLVCSMVSAPGFSPSEKYLPLLWGMKELTPEIEKIAFDSLKNKDRNINIVAAIIRGRDDLRKKLIDEIKVLESPLRATISNLLSEINTDDSAYNLLNNYSLEVDASIKIQSAIGLYTSPLSVSSDEMLSKSYERLKSEVYAVGIDFREVREAAICGIIATKQLHLAKELKDPYKKSDFKIPIEHFGLNTSEVYYSYLVKEWDYINTVFPDFINDLEDKDLNYFFMYLSPYIDSNDSLKEKFREYLYSSRLSVNDRILISASKVITGESALLRMCFKSLGLLNNETNKENVVYRADSVLALHILRKQFYGDSQVNNFLEELYARRKDNLDVVLVVSILTGFEDKPYVKEIKKSLKGKEVWLPTHFHILSSISNKKIIDEVISIMGYLHAAPRQYSKYFCSVMSELINEKSTFERELVKYIKTEKSIQIKLPLLVLYSQSKGLSKFTKDIAIEIYNKQKRKLVSDIVFDISEGQYSVSTSILIDMLYNQA